MVLVVPEQSQRPYRFGMTLLCVGALFNWLGLADSYSEPVPAIRYIGVGLIAAGASLICMAMCFWMRNIHDPNIGNAPSDPVHVITIDPSLEKPPDYSTVVDIPPCYEDAIKLNNSASKIVAVHASKHATTMTTTITSNESANDVSGKNTSTTTTERNNSSQFASQQYDSPDFSTQVTTSERRTNEKCDPEMSQNSSQNENALAKVLRKSIRGIRRLRSGSDDNIDIQSNEAVCTVENGLIPDRVATEITTKVER